MGHYRSAQVVKGDHKSSLSLQVSWQRVISQVIHCRLQQVRAGAEGHYKSVHIAPITAGLTESHGHSRESRDVTLLPMVPLGPSMGRVGSVRRFQGVSVLVTVPTRCRVPRGPSSHQPKPVYGEKCILCREPKRAWAPIQQ